MSKAKRRLTAASRLAVRHQENEQEERQAALCGLLRNPLLTATGKGAATFTLVRRHAPWLKKWFGRWPNWPLVTTASIARLRKHPSPRRDATRGLIDRSSSSDKACFTRRRYALLCLVMAMLENEQRQTTIQQVARKTEVFVRVNPEFSQLGFTFDARQLSHRRELVAVMRFLQQQHVLVRADGDDAGYVQGNGDCLYRIERASLAMVLCSVQGASTVVESTLDDFIVALNEVDVPELDEARNRNLQNMLVRRLLDDPVMYFDELTPREYDYFNDQGERILKELCQTTGLVAERRAEGVALLDPAGDCTDVGLPESGTRGHATLLLAEWFGDRLKSQDMRGPGTSMPEANGSLAGAGSLSHNNISMADVQEQVGKLAYIHGSRWRKNANSPEGIRQLMDDSLDLLESLALIDIVGGNIVPRPAVARYSLTAVVAPPAEEGK